MLNWVAVLRRILRLYGVRSTRELGMALGVPIKLEEEGFGGQAIPWPILEMVVSDKGISWDWVLTGREYSPGAKTEVRNVGEPLDLPPSVKKPPLSAVQLQSARLPRIETRELRRTLLDGTGRVQEPSFPEAGAEEEAPGELIDQPVEEMPTFDLLQPSEKANREREETVVRELQAIKSTMEAELKRVEEILRERGDDGRGKA